MYVCPTGYGWANAFAFARIAITPWRAMHYWIGYSSGSDFDRGCERSAASMFRGSVIHLICQ